MTEVAELPSAGLLLGDRLYAPPDGAPWRRTARLPMLTVPLLARSVAARPGKA